MWQRVYRSFMVAASWSAPRCYLSAGRHAATQCQRLHTASVSCTQSVLPKAMHLTPENASGMQNPEVLVPYAGPTCSGARACRTRA